MLGSSYRQHPGAGSTPSRRAASSPIPGRVLLAVPPTVVPLAAPPRASLVSLEEPKRPKALAAAEKVAGAHSAGPCWIPRGIQAQGGLR